MARAYTPPFRPDYVEPPPRRQVMSVGELEHMYGRNAQVELRSPPMTAERSFYPSNPSPEYGSTAPYEYDEDSIDLPVRRSPWLPVVVVMMLAVGGFFGYALYQRGAIPAQFVPAALRTHRLALNNGPALRETESVPVQAAFAVPKTLPVLSTGDTPLLSTISAARPAEEAPRDGEVTTNPTDALSNGGGAANATTSGAAKPKARVRARSANEDQAATLRAIDRDRAGAKDTPESSAYPEPTPPPDQTPPGYIEADTP